MPPTYVKAYVKRGKNDAADAAAICEVVTRPSMRFVPIKSVEQQSALMLHRTRDLLIRQRTQLINALRAHQAELGLVAAKGREGLQQLVTAVTESGDERLPSDAGFACQAIVAQLHAVQAQVNGLDKRITQAHRANADSKRLDAIPGFGVILSTAIVATMTDPKAFKTGRELQPGSDWCRGRTPPVERNASARFPSRAIATYDDCWSSAQYPLSGPPGCGPTSIPG